MHGIHNNVTETVRCIVDGVIIILCMGLWQNPSAYSFDIDVYHDVVWSTHFSESSSSPFFFSQIRPKRSILESRLENPSPVIYVEWQLLLKMSYPSDRLRTLHVNLFILSHAISRTRGNGETKLHATNIWFFVEIRFSVVAIPPWCGLMIFVILFNILCFVIVLYTT